MDYPHGLPKWTTLNYLPSKKKKRFLKLGCSSIDSRKYCARSPPSCFINAAGQLFCRRIHSFVACAWTCAWMADTPRGGGGVLGGGVLLGIFDTQFQTKIFHFPHPFSDLAPKIHTRFQTFIVS